MASIDLKSKLLFLIANIVTTSKAPVTTSKALVTRSDALVPSSLLFQIAFVIAFRLRASNLEKSAPLSL